MMPFNKKVIRSEMDGGSINKKLILREDKCIALLLAAFTILLLTVTAPQIGLTWDEPTYIVAAETYVDWYRELIMHPSDALSVEGINRYWTNSHEHPPLSKVLSGFIWLGARHTFDDLTAHRLGNILMVGLLSALLYLLVTREYGRMAGLIAVFALLTMPRFFFHAHLAAIDIPVTVMIFAVTYTFWLGHDRPQVIWTLLLGLVWGLALATKIHALFIPPILLIAWVLIFRPKRYLFKRLAMMGVIGISVFILTWPWFYYDFVEHFKAYMGFMTITRLPVDQYYFGQHYAPPPWHFPFVITTLVTPFSLTILAVVGAVSMMRHKEERPFGGLLLLGTFVCLAIFTSGMGQVFDNERFMMPVFPYLAALAGIGFVRAIPAIDQFLRNRKIQILRRQLVTLMAIVAFAPQVLLAYDLYPHLLSYYSEMIGGAYGAKMLGLESTYWCETYPEVLTYLNTLAKPGSVVWGECLDVLIYYRLHGQLRPDIQIANGPEAVSAFSTVQINPASFDEADYVIVQYRQSGFYRPFRKWMNARTPVFEFKYRRLRLADVYIQ